MGHDKKPKGWADIERNLRSKENDAVKVAHETQLKNYQNVIADLEHRIEVLIPLSKRIVHTRELDIKAGGKTLRDRGGGGQRLAR